MMLEGLTQSGGQLRGAVIIEQAEELRGEPGRRFATLEGRLEEGLACRDQGGQAAGGGRA
ncbi:MAG: hypothetical protein ACLQOO_29240 [Terriglobia bacterium]